MATATAVPGRLDLSADLDFSVEIDGRVMSGRLSGQGSDLTLELSDPDLLGGTGTGPARAVAAELARRGVRLTLLAGRPLVTLGAVRAPFWQRRVTGSRHIRVAGPLAGLRLLRLRRAPETPLVPPPSPLPLLPTFLRRRRTPTLTHDPEGGGYPRLVLAADPHPQPGDRQERFLLGDRTTIGSDPTCDVVLAGLAPLHAEVRRGDDDEFRIAPLVAGGSVRVHGAPVPAQSLLRTGARIDVGPWTMSFFREEYADHGRPFGGRIGGELGHQRPQPSREQIRRGAGPAPD